MVIYNEPLIKTITCSVLAFPLHSAQADISRLDLISETLLRGIYVALLNRALGRSAEKMKLEGKQCIPVALLLLSATQLQAIHSNSLNLSYLICNLRILLP